MARAPPPRPAESALLAAAELLPRRAMPRPAMIAGRAPAVSATFPRSCFRATRLRTSRTVAGEADAGAAAGAGAAGGAEVAAWSFDPWVGQEAWEVFLEERLEPEAAGGGDDGSGGGRDGSGGGSSVPGGAWARGGGRAGVGGGGEGVVSGSGDPFALPPNALVPCFRPLARRLAAASLAILHHEARHAPRPACHLPPTVHVLVHHRSSPSQAGHAAIRLSVTLHPTDGPPLHRSWRPRPEPNGGGGGPASEGGEPPTLRFPYFPPLLAVLEVTTRHLSERTATHAEPSHADGRLPWLEASPPSGGCASATRVSMLVMAAAWRPARRRSGSTFERCARRRRRCGTGCSSRCAQKSSEASPRC